MASMDDFYRDVARIALAVATKHGFVLGVAVSWAGIVGVNLAAAWGARRNR